MRKKILKLMVSLMLCVVTISTTSCKKETEKWEFNYPKEELCDVRWKATHYSPSGNGIWLTMHELGKSLSISFYEDGKYYSNGMFNTNGGQYTYSAKGNSIDILLDGRKLYDFTVLSWTYSTIELKMVIEGSSSSTACFRFDRN
jgi:hypothetical protein